MPNQLITRGLSVNCRQTLVVWGLQGPVICNVGSGPGSPTVYKEYVEQNKTVWFEESYKIVGCKSLSLRKTMVISGSIIKPVQESVDLSGVRSLKFSCERLIRGSRSTLLSEVSGIKGVKELGLTESVALKGSKKCLLLENRNIVGKKDNTELLSALVILDIV